MANKIGNRDGGKTSEEGLSRFTSNLVSGNTIGSGWLVSQRGAGANMSVDVAIGTGKIDTGSGYAYNVWSDAVNNVGITTADATNPRRDIIVAYVDKSVVSSASNDNPTALKFIAVAGTPAGSPSDPSAGTIQSAVGAGNPYIQLARVAVAASASSITNANITDLRTPLTVNANVGGSDGWSLLGYTPATVTANGNRSYSLAFTGGIDLTSQLSTGMRLRTTRTVAAPTQCTSLNGTTQYYSKSSPAGMTFTDDFVVSAWIKLTSYSVSLVASRFNGTSGWNMSLSASGQIGLAGYNGGSANLSYVQAYQSIPLNKWVHIACQLDMSSFTATPTTSYVMIDGVDVPATVGRGGTNPTALVQAGNLEIGSQNGGTTPFPGKIAQVAIYSAKVTQANVLATISQGLAGTETSLISAYSFNNSINDLNANANNLTANGSAVATNADSPFGGQADGTISSTLNYAIITKTAFSTNTTLTVQVPEGCTIPTSGGVSAVSYSTQKVPYLFPAQRGKWNVMWYNKTGTPLGNGATNNTWQSGPTNGVNAINIPVGEWRVTYVGDQYVDVGGAVAFDMYATLSTSNSSESDPFWTLYSKQGSTNANSFLTVAHSHPGGDISLSVATIYYMLGKAVSSSGSLNNHSFTATGTNYINADLSLL